MVIRDVNFGRVRRARSSDAVKRCVTPPRPISSEGSAAPASLAPTTMSINIARHAINRIVASPMTAPLSVVADDAPSDGL